VGLHPNIAMKYLNHLLFVHCLVYQLVAGYCEGECEQQTFLQKGKAFGEKTELQPTGAQPLADTDQTCGSGGFTEVPWPCDNDALKFGALQAINTEEDPIEDPEEDHDADRIPCQDQQANISVLDIGDTGEYTTVCQIPGLCLNGCGINPVDNFIYCRAWNTGSGTFWSGPIVRNNLVRITCPGLTTFTPGVAPVTGSACFLGRYDNPIAASFGVNGNYYWRDSTNIWYLNTTSLQELTASETPSNSRTQIDNKRVEAIQNGVSNRLADFTVVNRDLLGQGKANYLVGCERNRQVVIHNLDDQTEAPVSLTMSPIDGSIIPSIASGAQWFWTGTVPHTYCAFNNEGGVQVIELDTINLGDGTVNTGKVSESADTNSNDGMNCVLATPGPFPDPVPFCKHGQVDLNFSDSRGGVYVAGEYLTDLIFVDNFDAKSGTDCLQPAIFTPSNGVPTSPLLNCGCNLLVFASTSAWNNGNEVDSCLATRGRDRPDLRLGFKEKVDVVGITFYNQVNTEASQRTVIRYETGGTEVTVNVDNDGEEEQFVDLLAQVNNPANITFLEFRIGERPGIKSIRVCKPGGSDIGDPHINTMDGRHYLLLRQGTFMLWRFSGLSTQIPGAKVQSSPVEWTLFAHYSGHASYTKGLLLLDTSTSQPHALELTSHDCHWRSRQGQGEWTLVEKPQMMLVQDGSDDVTAMDVMWNSTNSKDYQNVKLTMNSEHGMKHLVTLHISCRPSHSINAAVIMERPGDRAYVRGQLGVTKKPSHDQGQGVSALQSASTQDQEFISDKSWTELGGTAMGQAYLDAADDVGSSFTKRSCGHADQVNAAKICTRHLGTAESDSFSDCVYDVCSGGGEVAAELMAVIVSKAK